MDHVLVRYSEIGTKSRDVAARMRARLRDRVAERLDHESCAHDTVELAPGRVIISTTDAQTAASAVAELPGVASASPARRVDVALDPIAAATDDLPIDSPFAVRANVAGEQPFASDDVERTVGARIQQRTGAAVDLTSPATTVEIDVRDRGAFVFTERYQGPGGFPVGSQDSLVALISGGIDSPVAAYEAMTRGADVVPVYCYNRPMAAGDHLVRFESALSRLIRMHPAKTWCYYLVDMEPVNERLTDIGTGRMILHRRVMFRAAAAVADETNCVGIVTGESLGQKSSQTAANLALTSAAVELPIHRPLLSVPKEDIVRRARSLGTYEDAIVDSACRTIAPDHPTAALSKNRLARLEAEVDMDALVEAAVEGTERSELQRPAT